MKKSSSTVPGPNDPCLCGSGKKWKKCHDPKSGVARGEYRQPPIEARLDPFLYELGMRAADALEDAIRAVDIDTSETGPAFAAAAVLTCAARAVRVGRSLFTLLHGGHTMAAHALGRSLFDAWIATMFYIDNPRRATFFTAFQPFKKLREADRLAQVAPEYYVEAFTHGLRADIERTRDKTIRSFPDIMTRPRIDARAKVREPLDVFAMLPRIARRLIATTVFPSDVRSYADRKRWVLERLGQTYWTYSSVSSQELHHTPLTLSTTLDVTAGGKVRGILEDYMKPNDLAFAFVAMLIDTFELLSEYRRLANAEEVNVLKAAREANRRRLSINTVGHRAWTRGESTA